MTHVSRPQLSLCVSLLEGLARLPAQVHHAAAAMRLARARGESAKRTVSCRNTKHLFRPLPLPPQTCKDHATGTHTVLSICWDGRAASTRHLEESRGDALASGAADAGRDDGRPHSPACAAAPPPLSLMTGRVCLNSSPAIALTFSEAGVSSASAIAPVRIDQCPPAGPRASGPCRLRF